MGTNDETRWLARSCSFHDPDSCGLCTAGLSAFRRIVKLDYAALCLEARVYIPSSVFDRVECGRQLGIVDGDEKETVYAWKDHDPAEWIISGFDHDGVMLYREQAVMEFPAGLESEYSWNQSGDI